MSIDPSRLTPLPLQFINDCGVGVVANEDQYPILLSEDGNYEDLNFFILARNAFDVICRVNPDIVLTVPHLFAYRFNGGVMNHQKRHEFVRFLQSLGKADFFTALVEADAWLTAQEKANG